jgi:hypothetical protein
MVFWAHRIIVVLTVGVIASFAVAVQPAAAAPGGVASAVCQTWRMVPIPAVDGQYLIGVSGSSAQDVWAVGGDNSGNSPGLALHWDGSAWSQFPVTLGFLQDVVDISPSDAWAVAGAGYPVYLQHWDGARWSLVKAPSPGFAYVNGIDAVSSDDMWTAGYHTGEGGIHPLVQHWDGVRWVVVPAPDGSPFGTNGFYDVSAISPDDVWAVGYQDVTGGANFQPLIEHWDGTSWNVVPAAPPPSGTNNQLYGVAAASSTDVWAVGLYGTSEPGAQPLIEHWDGSTWTVVDLPSLPGVDELFAATAITSSDVWAVGVSYPSHGSESRPFTMHWDGSTWTAYRAPPSAVNATLFGVWALSSKEVLAVGVATPNDVEPLVDRSRGVCG